MDLINEHINRIENIEQVSFDVILEIEKGLKLLNDKYKDSVLISLKRKLIEQRITKLNRTSLIEICNENKFNSKEKVLLILCWGIYFTVVSSQNSLNGRRLIEFINETDESFFNNLILEIRNTNENDKSSLILLFQKFNKEFKINGIRYPYFTKLFFFFSKNNSLPIMDKWLTKSFIYLVLNDSKINQFEKKEITNSIYQKNPLLENKSFNVKRTPSDFYFLYVTYLNQIAKLLNIRLGDLETFLFGWNLKEKSKLNEYTNPRVVYDDFFKSHFR